MSTQDLQDLPPLNHSILRILLALGNETMHGYAIMQSLSDKTMGRERLMPGSLYASLARMVGEEMIEEVAAPSGNPSGGPKRRFYRRTAFGREVAIAGSERMQVLLDVALAEGVIAARSQQ